MKSDMQILIDVLQDTEFDWIADRLKHALEQRDKEEEENHRQAYNSIHDNYGG